MNPALEDRALSAKRRSTKRPHDDEVESDKKDKPKQKIRRTHDRPDDGPNPIQQIDLPDQRDEHSSERRKDRRDRSENAAARSVRARRAPAENPRDPLTRKLAAMRRQKLKGGTPKSSTKRSEREGGEPPKFRPRPEPYSNLSARQIMESEIKSDNQKSVRTRPQLQNPDVFMFRRTSMNIPTTQRTTH